VRYIIYKIEFIWVYLCVLVERVADCHLARRKGDARHICYSNKGIWNMRVSEYGKERVYDIECMCVYLCVSVERVADCNLARRNRDAHHVCHILERMHNIKF